jgi:TPR repeat protein
MTHRIACLVACFAGALALAAGRPAHADSAQLHWEYQCLKDPDAVCFDSTPSGADPLAPKPAPVAAPAAPSEESPPVNQAVASPLRAAPPAAAPPAGTPAGKSAATAATSDLLGPIAARLRAGKPTPQDIAALQARARQGKVRALELLGWAELLGVGVPRDPVQAYFHYGMAAAAGLPTGRRDQAAIFTNDLTNEERQQILLIENGDRGQGRN